MENLRNRYVLDYADRITSVGPEWDAFALENDAPKATKSHVIGRRLWDFVSGLETQTYLKEIFHACRLDDQEFSMLYRCDAPGTRRLFRLSIRPGEDRSLVIDHTLVRAETRPENTKVVSLSDYYDCTRCSICCAFLVGDHWLDASVRPDSRYFARSYAVCPKCKKTAEAAMQK